MSEKKEIDQALLEILVCPLSKAELRYDKENNDMYYLKSCGFIVKL